MSQLARENCRLDWYRELEVEIAHDEIKLRVSVFFNFATVFQSRPSKLDILLLFILAQESIGVDEVVGQ